MQENKLHSQAAADSTAFQAIGIEKYYEEVGSRIEVLKGVDFDVAPGDTDAPGRHKGCHEDRRCGQCTGLSRPRWLEQLIDPQLDVRGRLNRAGTTGRQVRG